MTEQWTITNPNKTPSQIAQAFADAVYPGRKAMPVDGHWYARDYRGTFQLQDGNRTYDLTCNRFGEYTIGVRS